MIFGLFNKKRFGVSVNDEIRYSKEFRSDISGMYDLIRYHGKTEKSSSDFIVFIDKNCELDFIFEITFKNENESKKLDEVIFDIQRKLALVYSCTKPFSKERILICRLYGVDVAQHMEECCFDNVKDKIGLVNHGQ